MNRRVWHPDKAVQPDVRSIPRRLLEPIGNIPPVKAEERYYARVAETAVAA